MVIMHNDHGVEKEMSNLLHRVSRSTLHFARTVSYVGLNLQNAIGAIKEASSSILPEGNLGSIGYACSSGSFLLDQEVILKALMYGRSKSIPTFTVRSAVLAALEALNVRNIAIFTPYDKPTTEMVVKGISGAAVKTTNIGFLELATDHEISSLRPDTLLQFAASLDSPETEAIIILCNALQTLPMVPKLERLIGKPVITGNHALLWQCLRAVGDIKSCSSENGLLFNA